MGGLDHRAVERVDPAAHAHQAPLIVLDGDARGLEQPAVARRDGDREVVAPVLAEVQVSAAAHDGSRPDTALDKLEAVERAARLGNGPHAVAGLGPDTPAPGARAALVHQHLGNRRTVVDQAVDPREAGVEQRRLNPGAVGSPHEMDAQPAVPVPPGAAEGQADPAAEHQPRERLLRFPRKRPGSGLRPAVPHARSLDTGKPHRLPVVEQHRAAIDDLNHARLGLGREARRQRDNRPVRNAFARHGEQKEDERGKAGHRGSIARRYCARRQTRSGM